MRYWIAALLLITASPAYAVERYLSPTGSNSNTCVQAQDPTTPKLTFASIKACMAAGDTTYIASGTYNELFDLTGLPGSDVNRFRFVGTGTAPVFLARTTATSCRSIVTSSTTVGVWVENIKFSAVGVAGCLTTVPMVGNRIDNARFVTFRDSEVVGFPSNLYVTEASNILFHGGSVHDSPTDCADGRRHQAFYLHTNNVNITIEDMDLYNQPGGGIQDYPGSINGLTIRRNRIHHNSWCTSTDQGGITIFRDSSSTGTHVNVKIYDNLIYKNADPTGGRAHGIRVAGDIVNGVEIYNNTIYGNQNNSATGATTFGIITQTATCPTGSCSPTGVIIKNNLVIGNEGGQISTTAGTGHVVSNNITTGVASDYFVDAANDDYRLKQGTNTARDTGASVSTRVPVGTSDVGAYEQGVLSSAVVVSKFIEVTTSVMTPPLQPASGVSGLTITCIGCTGSPVVSQAVLKAGSATILQLSISGISSPGSCSLSLGSTNLKDSGTIGVSSQGYAQGLNSVTGLSVSGTCENTVAGGGAPTPSHSRFLLDEGSGTVATDDTGGGNHGTVSSGVTWVSGPSGTGVTIPADTTYRQITTTFGAGVDPTTQSFAQCVDVELDLSAVPSIVISSGGNGSGQRAYVGVYNVGGQPQWGLGVQSSGFTTGSEFVAVAQRTIVCVTFDSATDTATLWVDGVKGTQSGKSVKTYTSYGLVGNLRVGNDGTFTTNNGGFTVYTVWTWNTLPSDADLLALYAAEFPSGTPLACHEQKTHKWELTRVDGSNTPVSVGTTGGSVDVVDGGGVALVIQIDCTTVAGAPLALRFYYSTDGATYSFEIPTSLGTDGIALWGIDTSANLNDGTVTCCITGALTPTTGSTIKTVNSTPIISLAQNQSWTVRVLLRLGTGLVGQSRYIILKQDNGLNLANGYAIGGARINVIPNRAGTGF